MQLTWSTEHIAPARRVDFWRGAVCEAFLAMTPRIPDGDDFDARLAHLAIERLALNRVLAPRHGVLRTAHDLARGEPGHLFVNLNRRGRGWVRQGGREQLAAAGELMLIDSTAAYQIELVDGGELLSLALPLSLVRDALPRLAERSACTVPETPAASLLRAQLVALADCGEALPIDQAGAIADSLVALAAAALDGRQGPRAGHGGLARRLRCLIAQHVEDPRFGPAQAARLAGVSLRSVHAAMAQEGSSFKGAQMEYRLQRARQRLAVQTTRWRIAELAAECGFVSAEHFSRRYRARFGITPASKRA